MAFFTQLLISVAVGTVSLGIASKATHTNIFWPKIILIAFLAQFLTPYLLGYLTPFLYFLPFVTFLIRLFVWVALVKFVVQRISIIDAILLGAFSFGIGYLFSLLGIKEMLGRIIFG